MKRREFSFARVFDRRALWFPLALAIGGAVVLFAAQAYLADIGDGAEQRVSTWVRIDQRLIQVEQDASGDERRTPLLFFDLETRDGRSHEITLAVSQDLFLATEPGSWRLAAYRSGAPQDVVLDPREPSVFQIAFQSILNAAPALLVLGAVTMLVGMGLLIHHALSIRSMLRAQRDGEVREARVIRRERSRLKLFFRRPLWQVVWQDAAGQRGRSSRMRAADLPADDSVIVVYIDPRTGRGWWETEF